MTVTEAGSESQVLAPPPGADVPPAGPAPAEAPPGGGPEGPEGGAGGPAGAPGAELATADIERPINPTMIGVSSFLAVAAAGWMFAGVFQGSLARVIGVAGALIGAGIVTYSYRTSRPSLVQYLVIPVAVGIGVLLVVPFASSGNIIGLVTSAVRTGGIAHPPVSFDPGWRFILLVLVAVLGAAASTLAISLRRPKLGIALPAPLIFATALVQPPDATLTSTAVALVLFIAAFGVSYGADLAKEGASSGRFEARRLGRGAGVLVLLVIVLIILSQSGFLLPKSQKQPVIPPEFPRTPPPQPFRTLFTVKVSQPQPLRLGVLDVYQANGWYTPPYDVGRFETVPDGGRITPGKTILGEVPRIPPPKDHAKSQTVTFEVKKIGGHLLPDVANPLALPHRGFTLQYDPRTQALNLPDQIATNGLTYTEVAPAIPTAGELETAGSPPKGMDQYVAAPKVPAYIAGLLAKAPTDNAFSRLQYMRNIYYQKVVAKGAGNPIRVPPSMVVQMFHGKAESPFAIVAGEVLLARWSGVPARLGYGYYSTTPDKTGGDLYTITPDDGAVWLEVYFNHYGWVPIVGTPPKAQASIDNKPKKHNPAVVPSSRLDLQVYVPVKLSNVQLLFTILDYYGVRAIPVVAGLVLLYLFYPGFLKMYRKRRRRRWAGERGYAERIAVAYAELRDWAWDLNLGDVNFTPLEFVAATAEDTEHRELAWLTTRALWGDLTRDLRREDAEVAEDLSRSVLRRVRRAAQPLNLVVAFGSRTSLRAPYAADIPNVWPGWQPRRRVRIILSTIFSKIPRPRRRAVAGPSRLRRLLPWGAR